MSFRKILMLMTLSACASHRGELKFDVMKNIPYSQESSERQTGDLYVPKGKGPFPGVIRVHGGGWKSRDKSDMNSIAESLASQGFSVFNINYRFAPAHKHPAPVDDLHQALEHFTKNAASYRLNQNSIGLWGYSSGGHTVSFYALKKKNKIIRAVVAGGAPYDFSWYPKSPYIKGYLGDYRDQLLFQYHEASATTHIHPEAPPFFLYHAIKDELVEYAQATSFQAKLKMAGVKAEVHEVSFWGHAGAFAVPDEPVESGIKFLKQHL